MASKKDGEKLPDFIKGKVIHYPYGEYPKVKAGDDVYGYATAHTPTAVIVQWDDGERVHSEWFPASLVQRVTDEDWHGKWMAH